MKEKFKKLLKMFAICCMALVSCFSIFACGETPDDPETEQGGGSGQEAPEGVTGTPVTETIAVDKFNQLKTARDAMTPNNGYTYTDEGTTKQEATPNWDAFERNKVAKMAGVDASLADDTIFNAFKSGIDDGLSSMNGEYSSKEITSYNSTTKNGYYLYESPNQRSYEISDIENNTLYDYSKWGSDEATQRKYNIDQNYYNQFYFDFYDAMEYSVGEVLKDTLEETESYLRNGFEAMGLTFVEDDLGFTFEEKDGLSTLVVYANVTDKTMNLYGESLTGADFTMSLVFKFNSTMLTELSAVMDLDATMAMAVGQDANGNDVNLSIAFAMDNTQKFTFSNTYDAEHAPSYTASEFVGEDMEVVTNNDSEVYLHIGDYAFGYGKGFRMGESLDFSGYNGYSDVFTGSGLNDITWYTDKACTQEFTATTMPSYDINLYAKYNDVLAKLDVNHAFVLKMSTSNYVDGVDYEAYMVPRISITEKTGTVSAEEYTCAYVNGTKVNAGASYTLTSGLNKIIFVYKPGYY